MKCKKKDIRFNVKSVMILYLVHSGQTPTNTHKHQALVFRSFKGLLCTNSQIK